MDTKKFIDSHKEYKEKISLFVDKIFKVKKTSNEVFTDFLNPDERALLNILCKEEGLYLGSFGGKGYCEREICVINEYEYDGEFPVDVIKINGNFKFEKLNHRDYLGVILSLGIKRDKIGDINVFDDGAEIWVHKDVCDYLCFNISKIKHSGVKTEKIEFKNAREKSQEFKAIIINVSSMRLDCIVSSLTGLSRNEASSIIKRGDVKVEFINTYEISQIIKEKQLLSIRGFGRYFIDFITGKTKSGRLNVSAKKYI